MALPRVLIEPDARAACARAADLIVEAAAAAVAEKPFTLALSGGATPRELYRLLSGARAAELPWDALDFWFGDERCVPFGDEAANFELASETLFAPARVDPARVHRMEGELPPEEGARRYEEALRARFGAGKPPAFDLDLLGLGPDGHTASLFPGTAALDEETRWVVPNEAPVEPKRRLTLTFPVHNAAKRVLFLAAGADKADAVTRALKTGDVPAARVRPAGELVWVLDEAAASKL
jgi:6-phosphogluconolactonase